MHSQRWQPSPDPNNIHIPGLDTNAPPSEQIEQIEQLITLKLQNIDENFSKIHHILSTRILPAVKRYAVATEPVRDAAKFWVSFYEQAAQIRIPTYEEEENEAPVDEPTTTTEPTTSDQTASYETASTTDESSEESIISSDETNTTAAEESSFMPAQGAISSTPATNRHLSSQDPSWSAGTSLESPLVRLDRELQNFSKEDLADITTTSTFLDPLLRTVLRHTIVPPSRTPQISPLKPRKLKTPASKHSFYARTPAAKEEEDEDDSFSGLPPGMSPPAIHVSWLIKTPGTVAIKRITRDVVNDVRGVAEGRGAGENTTTSNSSVLTPPSLSRYAPRDSSGSVVMDSSLESMMRRVGLRADPESPGVLYDDDADVQQDQQQGFMTPTPHQYDDDDEDSFFDDTAHPGGGSGPSAAFLMASQNRRRMDADESFDSVDDDDGGVASGEVAPVHPFARGIGINIDDSFDDDDSYEADMRGASPSQETLFGVPPGQREQQQHGLRLHGGNVFDDTVEGLTEQIALQVADSPTPAAGGWR
ncbi:DASH complex subunit ask1 [Paramarasmius palmivorus]|uniref:DASH complex subunit ASK1 n=1 Tax=Paramarasmius palmivorus TaxID=297713 RepID=A0AAW0CVM3_9AGAR